MLEQICAWVSLIFLNESNGDESDSRMIYSFSQTFYHFKTPFILNDFITHSLLHENDSKCYSNMFYLTFDMRNRKVSDPDVVTESKKWNKLRHEHCDTDLCDLITFSLNSFTETAADSRRSHMIKASNHDSHTLQRLTALLKEQFSQKSPFWRHLLALMPFV